MSRKFIARAAFGFITALSLAGACSVYDETLLIDGPQQDASTGGAGGTGASGGTAGVSDAKLDNTPADTGDGSCALKRPPPRPAAMPAEGGPGEIIFVLKDMTFDQGNIWDTIGYDLDDLCTYPPENATECQPPNAGQDPEIDGMDGSDNAFGHSVLPIVVGAVPGLEKDLQRVQAGGQGAILIKINGWNGEDDDNQVSVVIAQTTTGTPILDGSIPPRPDGGVLDPDAGPDAGGNTNPPLWDGNDAFWVRSDQFVGGDVSKPKVLDNNAYIANRVLVTRLPDRQDLVFAGAVQGVKIKLTDSFITGEISQDMTHLNNARLAGRWAINDVLDTADSAGICGMFFSILETVLEDASDVRSAPGTGGPNVPCDALSVAFAFNGFRGSFGGLDVGLSLVDRCADSGTP